MDKDPKLEALKQDRSYLQDLLDQQGWKVVEGLVRQIQAQATSVLKADKEAQALFQAQGLLQAFEKLWGSIEALRDANDDELKAMIGD